MRMDMTADAVTFLVTVLSGLSCGALFDVFRVLGVCADKKRLIPFLDLIYISASAIIVVFVFYIFNSYQLRLFMFVGVLLGLILYFLLLSRVFVVILKKIIKIIHFIFKILLTPARFLCKILVVCVFSPAKKCFAGIVNFLGKKIKKIKKIRGQIGYEKNRDKKRNNKKRKNKIVRYHSGSFSTGNVNKRCDATATDN